MRMPELRTVAGGAVQGQYERWLCAAHGLGVSRGAAALSCCRLISTGRCKSFQPALLCQPASYVM